MKADNGDRADVNKSGGTESRRSERKPSRQEHRAKPRGKSGRDASGELNGKPERYASERPHGQSRRNKPSEQHDRFGQSKPSEQHDRFGWNKPGEMDSQTGRNRSSEIHGQTGRNRSSEMHSQTGRNKSSELHGQTGRAAAQNRLPKTRIDSELPRGKTELYSFESDISEASDVFEIRQYVVGEDRSEKLLSLLGFAARARRLVFGTDLCRAAARAGQISLALIVNLPYRRRYSRAGSARAASPRSSDLMTTTSLPVSRRCAHVKPWISNRTERMINTIWQQIKRIRHESVI